MNVSALSPEPAACATAKSGARWQSAELRRILLYMVPVAVIVAFMTSGPDWRNPLALALNFGYAYLFAAGLGVGNSLLADWLSLRVSWTKEPTKRLWLSLTLTPLVSAIIIGAVDGLTVAIWQLSHHALLFRISWFWNFWFPLVITSVISLGFHSSIFLRNWQAAAVRAERLEKETAVARLDSLRRQVDPHFLFNSLNALTSLVEEDPTRAVRFIRQLSSVYRYVLDSQSQELVPLGEELVFAESYIFLQKTRLADALCVEFSGREATASGFYLPPLALQLLLENALKHNTAYQADPLRLRVSVDAAVATLTVRNTLRPRRLPADEASGRGLANLRARYAFLTTCPVEAGPVGEEFVVTLPLLKL
ncbi:sensor histidine kinase [Hymenobacter sp. BRD67]|uniref:sensor histidine kinase n=1 Tax=Hymenobacter sp. BRD67 TaxID=2675877 RepID=UPI0015646E29|nr:sensor histidine kinase [Hymenobacter sp. BRD67]QKG52832.1 histidine kinase [Hymenobacter sp. BRD67]